jgi:plastocyanin
MHPLSSWFGRVAVAILLSAATLVGPAAGDAAPLPGTPGAVVAPLGASQGVGFVLPVMAVAEGGSLTFANLDTVIHNVVCDQVNPVTRRPICSSGDPIVTGGTATVAGVENLAPGTYALHCQPHEQMTLQLNVVDTP